ncbi:MAG TPA: BON domain-containing protein [Vicinamibacterales bacterium]
MRLSHLFVAAILVGGPVASVSAAVPQKTMSKAAVNNDKAIEDRIEKRVARDSSLKNFSIKIDVEQGVATLKGTVATEADRGKVAEIATRSGATRVDNQLVADMDAASKPKGTAGKIEQKTSDAAAKTKEAGSKAIDKTKEAGEKTAEIATDTWITSRIKTKMVGEDALKNSDVHVSTDDHVVTLTGYVASAAGRARAVEIAKSIEGVRSVVDKLTIK